MKKSLLGLALLSLGITANTHAQFIQKRIKPSNRAVTQTIRTQRMHDALLRQLTGSGQPATASKTTTTAPDERLLAQSTYRFYDATGSGIDSFMATDSTKYAYTNPRGSYFNFNRMSYVDYYDLYYAVFLGQGNLTGLRDKDNKPEVLSDSNRYYGLMSADTLEHYETIQYTYDASGNIVDCLDDAPGYSYTARTINTFNADGITSVLNIDNTSGALDTTGRRILGYTAGKLTRDSSTTYYSGMWSDYASYAYTYDATGKATRMSLMMYDASSSTWYEDTRYDLEYYPTNQLKKVTSYYGDIANPVALNEVDTFAWTTGISYYTDVRTTYYGSDTMPYVTYAQTKHISATNNLPDSVYFTVYVPSMTAPVSTSVDVFTYDSYNKPTHDIVLTNRMAGTALDSVTNHIHYYYEIYDRDITGVNTVAANASNITLYPNPATSQLYINQGNVVAGKEISTAKVYNITGQLIINTPCTTTGGHAQININTLPQGTYLVLLQSATGEILHKEKVVKL